MSDALPLPELAQESTGFAYNIAYVVTAETRLEAIDKATTGLRSALSLRGVHRDEQLPNGQWRVVLSVWENA